jgi:hypothetical protein
MMLDDCGGVFSMSDVTANNKWLFDAKAKAQLVTRLFTKLAGSVVLTKVETSKKHKKIATKSAGKENVPAAVPKGRAASKTKGPACQKPKGPKKLMNPKLAKLHEEWHVDLADRSETMTEVPTESVFEDPASLSAVDSGRTRPKWWVDDLVIAVNKAAARCSVDTQSDGSVHVAKTYVLRLGLLFCFTGTVTVDGKQFKRWSALRPILQGLLVQTHGKARICFMLAVNMLILITI